MWRLSRSASNAAKLNGCAANQHGQGHNNTLPTTGQHPEKASFSAFAVQSGGEKT
jgi:hypothetical protein